MSKSVKVILAVVSLISLSILGWGLVRGQDIFIVIGTILITPLIVGGIVVGMIVFFKRVLPNLDKKTIAIIFGSVCLILVILVFIAPPIAGFVGGIATFAPIPIYLVLLRTRDVEFGKGCGSVLLFTIGGLVLLGLLWLFQREWFYLTMELFGLGTQ